MKDYKISSQVFVAFIANIGIVLYGIGLGWSATSEVKILETERNYDITSTQFSWAVAMNSIGSCFGCFVSGVIRDRVGTKKSILIFTVPSLCGWLLLTLSQYWWMLIIGRLLTGIAAAGYSHNVLTYVGECASKEIRGILLTFYEVCIASGILFTYVIGSFTKQVISDAICAALVIGYGIAFTFLPESPLYLTMQHKTEEAKKSLQYLRGKHYKMDNELANFQMQIAELEQSRKPFWQEIQTPATRKAFVILISMFFFFQMCGVSAVVFYTTTILIETGIKIDPFVATCILGAIQVLTVLSSTAFIDRFGRRILLIGSNAIMMVALLGVGTYFQIKESHSVSGFEWLPLFLLCIYFIGFSGGVGGVTFVLLGELFSMNAKRAIGPISQVPNFFMAFIIAIFFPMVADNIGMQYSFFLFAGFCLIAIVFIVFMLPETKGKSLVEIQKILTNEHN